MNAYSQNPTQWLQSLGTLLFLVVCFSCKPVDTKTGNTDDKEAKDTVVAAPAKQYDRYWNDAARYFGGLEPLAGSVLK